MSLMIGRSDVGTTWLQHATSAMANTDLMIWELSNQTYDHYVIIIPQIALAIGPIGVLTSSIGVRVRSFFGFVV